MTPLSKLKPGKCFHPQACTLAESLFNEKKFSLLKVYNDRVEITPASSSDDIQIIPLPKYVSSFIRGFDGGLYPHLIKKEKTA